MDTDPVIKGNIHKLDIDRFFKYVPSIQHGCWEWQGQGMRNGYGEFYYGGGPVYAHRMSFLIYYGDIPSGKLVLHTCDNKRCVNPKHLYPGTHSQNLMDSYTRHPETRGRRWYNRERRNIVCP